MAELIKHSSELSAIASLEKSPTFSEMFTTFSKVATGLNGDAVGPRNEFELVLLNGLAHGTIKHPSVLERESDEELGVMQKLTCLWLVCLLVLIVAVWLPPLTLESGGSLAIVRNCKTFSICATQELELGSARVLM